MESVDILVLGGGNTYYLMYWVIKSGLDKLLSEFLKNKVYVGISAGSQIMNPLIDLPLMNDLFDREENEFDQVNGLNYVDFYTIPHYKSKYFPKLTEENVKKASGKVDLPVYALDDNSAIMVDNDKVDIISEGDWLKV